MRHQHAKSHSCGPVGLAGRLLYSPPHTTQLTPAQPCPCPILCCLLSLQLPSLQALTLHCVPLKTFTLTTANTPQDQHPPWRQL